MCHRHLYHRHQVLQTFVSQKLCITDIFISYSFHERTGYKMNFKDQSKWVDHTYVRPNDTDINGIASASAILGYLQDAAYNQHFYCGPSLDSLRESGRAYILSRVAMRILKPLYACDKIDVESWACPSSGFSLHRCADIIKDGEPIARLSSIWALADIETRRLCKVDELTLGFGEDKPIDPKVPIRFTIPTDLTLSKNGTHTVSYSDADINGHMHNTVYPNMLCNYLPGQNEKANDETADTGFTIHRNSRPALTGKRVSTLSISFITEARIGEKIDIYCGKDDSGVYYFRTKHTENPAIKAGIEARMEITDI